MAKEIRVKNHFFTSRCFMLYHLVQNIIFWMVVIIFPIISIINCISGHSWMSHVAMGLYLGLSLLFDLVFAYEYQKKEGLKYDLQNYKNGLYVKEGKCTFMMKIWGTILFEVIMTQIGLFDIYCDVAFITIVKSAGLTNLMAVSCVSIVLLMIPKLYSLVLCVMMLFNCVREEDKRRKFAFRILIFDEWRL